MEPHHLIPHAGRMCWLDGVEDHSPEVTRCTLTVRASTPLSGATSRIPAHASLEYMAQTAAVHAALQARAASPGGGLGRVALLGTRVFELARAWLEPGESLTAEAAPFAASTAGLAVFDANVRDAAGREVARARLNLYAETTADG